jgi:hypothetical protein
LTSVPEITIEDLTNTGENGPSGRIRVASGFDLDSKLEELAGSTSELKDWSRAN